LKLCPKCKRGKMRFIQWIEPQPNLSLRPEILDSS
jgi:hypothetical protein